MIRDAIKRDGFLALLVVLAVAIAAAAGMLRSLDGFVYDLGMNLSGARRPHADVIVVGIDDRSLREYGDWPWPPARLAQLLEAIGRAEPRAIGLALALDARDMPEALAAIERLRASVGETLDEPARAALDTAHRALDVYGPLARVLSTQNRVIIAVAEAGTGEIEQVSDAADWRALLRRDALSGLPALQGDWYTPFITPLGADGEPRRLELRALPAAVVSAATGAGFVLAEPAWQNTVRARHLVALSGDLRLPSFALRLVLFADGVAPAAVRFESGMLRWNERKLPVDQALRLLPHFYPADGEEPAIAHVSAADVLAGRSDAGRLQGRIAIVGVTATARARLRDTPVDDAMPAAVVEAQTVSAMLNGDVYRLPSWALAAQLLLFAVIAFYAGMILPRLRTAVAITSTTVLALVLFNAQLFLLFARALWLPLAAPLVALLAAHGALAVKHLLEGRLHRFRQELSEANRLLAEAWQAQGKLDAALERLRHCEPGPALAQTAYNLGLECERRRQFARAVEAFTLTLQVQPGYKDAEKRLELARRAEATVLFSGTRSGGFEPVLLDSDVIQRPLLGRYQIEKEIGRGSMGVVYLGRDPRIGRVVAIKTMALSREFDAAELEEVRQRFFREAQTAGRLSHPNIVTIYDVGEEHDLAYIAMDLLTGESLQRYTKREQLLPVPEVMTIGIQVAEALDYAHRNKIVHRDIKPANIIYDRDRKTVKVTDFGVAVITDASKTKTGTVLGSPSYMSPEQVSGQRVDGRSDIFSLAVTLYQLLTGELPFTAANLAALMYKIANEPHMDVRLLRPDLPPCLSLILNKAMEKDPAKRIQTGAILAEALRRCRSQPMAY
ncbi:MAG TPA: serine/threonine-protein kinase [Gammaproteobacteria bacterium]|nr:serine/threonine-protein kinase [Gammaproteobacteria bacterium]